MSNVTFHIRLQALDETLPLARVYSSAIERPVASNRTIRPAAYW